MKRFSVLRLLALFVIYGGFLGLGFTYFVYVEFSRELPKKLDSIVNYRPARATRVYSADGELIGEFFLQKRVVVPLERVPLHVRQAFISAEDRRFRVHTGFDPIGITRAAYENYIGGGIRQGASTITQQVSRMLLLTRERTVSRKIKEIILSVRVERELNKDQILWIYLNQVYLGHGAYGVQAAAEAYFGKDVEHLTIAEAALLAGLPKAPTKFSPYNDYERARERQNYVMGRMRDDGVITADEYRAAKLEPLAIIAREQPVNYVAAPYFVEHIRLWAQETYGHSDLFDGGLRIYTTLDMKAQRAAEAAVRDGLHDLDRQLGFRGPVGRLETPAERDEFAEGPPRPYRPAIGGVVEMPMEVGSVLRDQPYLGLVTAMKPDKKLLEVDMGPRSMAVLPADAARMMRWKGERRERLQVGDLVPVMVTGDKEELHLAQQPDVQAALVAIDPADGGVRAMVGGYDFRQSQFNRVTQARRQAGSSIKPFIYATAIQAGYNELTIMPDSPVAVRTLTGVWAPKNYTRKYLGNITLRTALAKSINTVSVRLVVSVGLSELIKTMRKMGVESDIPRHISVSLGTNDVTLLEMTRAYATFPSGGRRVDALFVSQVSTDEGAIILDATKPKAPEMALEPAVAYVMADMMKVVVARGTGRKALLLGRPVGGKTGTATGYRDAWFIGFTADLVCGVWVGRDSFKPIGDDTTGGGVALPIWLQFMQAAHPATPVRDFPPPADVTFVRADEMTGAATAPGSPNAMWVPFVRGTVPDRFSTRVDGKQFSTSSGFQ